MKGTRTGSNVCGVASPTPRDRGGPVATSEQPTVIRGERGGCLRLRGCRAGFGSRRTGPAFGGRRTLRRRSRSEWGFAHQCSLKPLAAQNRRQFRRVSRVFETHQYLSLVQVVRLAKPRQHPTQKAHRAKRTRVRSRCGRRRQCSLKTLAAHGRHQWHPVPSSQSPGFPAG